MTTWKQLVFFTATVVACALAPLSAQAGSYSFEFSYSTGKYSQCHGPDRRHGWSYSWRGPWYYYCPPPVIYRYYCAPPVYYVPVPPPPPPRVIVCPRTGGPVYLYQGGRFEVR